MTPRHPSFEDVENAYREFYQRLFFYLDDAGAADILLAMESLAEETADENEAADEAADTAA